MMVTELIYVAAAPLVVAVLAALAMRRVRSPPPIQWAAGVGLGYVAGQFVLASRSGLARGLRSLSEPREASEWLPHAVVLALGVTVLATYAPRQWRNGALGLAFLLALAAPARLLAGHLAQKWSLVEKAAHLALLSATLALVWMLLAAAREHEFARLRQVLIVFVAVGVAIAVTLSGSFSMGRLCGLVAAALTGCAFVAPRGLAGAAGVVTMSLGSVILLAVFYARLHPASAGLLVVSLVAAAGPQPEAVQSWPVWQHVVVRSALCLTPLGIAVAISAG